MKLNWKIIFYILLNIYAVALFVVLINLSNNVKKLNNVVDNNSYIREIQLYNPSYVATYNLWVEFKYETLHLKYYTYISVATPDESLITEVKEKMPYTKISFENFEKIKGIMYNGNIEFMI